MESIGPSVQEKKQKIDFQDGGHGGHLGFPISMILSIFDLQVTPMLPNKFVESTGLSVQEKKRKIDFQDGGHGGHLGFPIGTILAIFDLQVTPMLPTKYPELAQGCRRSRLLKQLLTPHDGRRTTDID